MIIHTHNKDGVRFTSLRFRVAIRALTRNEISYESHHPLRCHGSGAHALDKYYVIGSMNPKVRLDGPVLSFVEYLYE